MTNTDASTLLWSPSRSRIEGSALYGFAQRTADASGAAADDYAALLDWSNRAPETFYAALWDELGIIGQKGDKAFEAGKTLRETRFYPDARLNYAENLLRDADDRPARGQLLPGEPEIEIALEVHPRHFRTVGIVEPQRGPQRLSGLAHGSLLSSDLPF